MTHPLVNQLRFTRSEWLRALDGVTAEEGTRRFLPMNSIGWIVGHLAWQEQDYWLSRAQAQIPLPEALDFGFGKPASIPTLANVLITWQKITGLCDPYLESLTGPVLESHLVLGTKIAKQSVGDMLHRMIYHYWYHTGEIMGIRQNLGHTGLPDFVGDISVAAPYTPG
jgi:DinB superfamily